MVENLRNFTFLGIFGKDIWWLISGYLEFTPHGCSNLYNQNYQRFLMNRNHKFRTLKRILSMNMTIYRASLAKIENSIWPLSKATWYWVGVSNEIFDCLWGYVIPWVRHLLAWTHEFALNGKTRLSGCTWDQGCIQQDTEGLIFWGSRCSSFSQSTHFFVLLDRLTLADLARCPRALILPLVACIFDRSSDPGREQSWLTMDEKWELRQALQQYFYLGANYSTLEQLSQVGAVGKLARIIKDT